MKEKLLMDEPLGSVSVEASKIKGVKTIGKLNDAVFEGRKMRVHDRITKMIHKASLEAEYIDS
jgi:hypothetical protein